MKALHSKKITAEKDAFLTELYGSFPALDELLKGELASKARRLHSSFLPLHILKHYTPADINLASQYFDAIFSHAIEAECLLVLGFKTSGVSALRLTFESSLKFLYYETHPVEYQLHNAGGDPLSNTEYREFLCSVPGLGDLPFVSKAAIEAMWKRLCQFVHSDLRAVALMSVVGDVNSALKAPEKEYAELLTLVEQIVRVAIAVALYLRPGWLGSVEKTYFDAVMECFDIEDRSVTRTKLRIV